MMSHDKYERGRQHLNGGHQRITYKKKKKETKNGILTLRLTQSNQWLGVGHAARIHWLNSPPMSLTFLVAEQHVYCYAGVLLFKLINPLN